MKIIIFKEVESDVEPCDLVTYDASTNKYKKANDEKFIGVVKSVYTENGKNMASLSFKGIQQVKLSRNIGIEGGFLAIENGKAYIDNSSTRTSFIYPIMPILEADVLDEESPPTTLKDENNNYYIAQDELVYIQLY